MTETNHGASFSDDIESRRATKACKTESVKTAARESKQTAENRKRFNERHANMGRYYLSLQRSRVSSSANITLVTLSFCFLFEATIFAKYSPSDFSIEILAVHAIPITEMLAANIMLVISLCLSIRCTEKMRVMLPIFRGSFPIPTKKKIDYEAEWLIEEFAHLQYALDCANCARYTLNFAQFLALTGICNAALGILWAIFIRTPFDLFCCIAIAIPTVTVIAIANFLAVYPKAKALKEYYSKKWPGNDPNDLLDHLHRLKDDYRSKLEGNWWCDEQD